MSADQPFLDTNIILYILSEDAAKADRAEAIVAAGGVISVQVLNEIAAVASRKLRMHWDEIAQVLHAVRTACDVRPLSVTDHEVALDLAGRHQLSFYDSLILASAANAKCRTLFSEDMQHGQQISGVTVVNPFKA